MITRYVYNPIKEDIYLYNGRPITVQTNYGHTSIWDLKGNFIEVFEQYSEEAESISENSIGKLIRPRWDKQYQTWETYERGLTYEQIHTRYETR
jgi:hypothetical protein